MPVAVIFLSQTLLGYVAWLVWLFSYGRRQASTMSPPDMHRAIAMLHSFRFFGLVFIVPGVVGSGLPGAFADFAAYGDLATGLLALMAVLTFGSRPLFWLFVLGFNVVGIIDLISNYVHASQLGLPESAGDLGAAYVIPIIYVPLLMITHIVAFYSMARQILAGRTAAGQPAAR